MDEGMAKTAAELGLTCDGDIFYGVYNGYHISGKYTRSFASVGVSVSLTAEQRESVRVLAMGIAMRYPGTHRISASRRGVSATFPVGWDAPYKMISYISEVIAAISTFTNGEACPF